MPFVACVPLGFGRWFFGTESSGIVPIPCLVPVSDLMMGRLCLVFGVSFLRFYVDLLGCFWGRSARSDVFGLFGHLSLAGEWEKGSFPLILG